MQTIARKGKLVLKDGSVYEGELYGKRNAVGEVVFTTGMSGYQETLTDPSFCGQIVVMTYPLVGNYGTNDLFNQGRKSFFQGYVISELCDHPSNWRCEKTLEQFLDEQDVRVRLPVNFAIMVYCRVLSCRQKCRRRKWKSCWLHQKYMIR